MSHQPTGRTLSEWAALTGASLPESVEEREDAAPVTGQEGFRDAYRDDIGN